MSAFRGLEFDVASRFLENFCSPFLKKQAVNVWIGLKWLAIGSRRDSYEHGRPTGYVEGLQKEMGHFRDQLSD